MNPKRFIEHHGLFCLLFLIVVFSVVAYFKHWVDSKDIVPLSTLCVTAVLAAITWQYVRTTQKTLDLFKEQWDYQQQIGLAFGLKKRNGKAWLRIANIGGVRVFVMKAVFRQLQKTPFTRNTVRVVREGENYGFYIPEGVYKKEPYYCDVDVTLHYRGYGKGEETMSRAFRLELSNGKIDHILSGVHAGWDVSCPECKERVFGGMVTENLPNFEAAYEREAILMAELKATCPQHQSLLLDSIELVRERNKKEKEKGIQE